MSRVALTALAACALGCASAAVDPCATALGQLDDAAVARVQALTAADDARAQAGWVETAMRQCAHQDDQRRAHMHAQVLVARLGASGAHAELLALARLLDGTPMGTALRDAVRHGASTAQASLQRMVEDNASAHPQDARALAWAAQAGLGQVAAVKGPTTAAVTRAGPQELCATVVAGTDRPLGTVTARLLQGETPMPLAGELPVASWSAERAPPLTACTRVAWQPGTRMTLEVSGAVTHRFLLEPDALARVAALARMALGGTPVPQPPECAAPTEPRLVRACSLAFPTAAAGSAP